MSTPPEPNHKLLLVIRQALMLVLGAIEEYLGLDRTYRRRLKQHKEQQGRE